MGNLIINLTINYIKNLHHFFSPVAVGKLFESDIDNLKGQKELESKNVPFITISLAVLVITN